MNSEDPKQVDAALSRTLETWKVAKPLPSRFAENVWRRIERELLPEPMGIWNRLLAWLCQGMLRPALAGSYLVVLLLAGTGVGYWRAQVVNERTGLELGARYVRLMDPYQMPRQ